MDDFTVDLEYNLKLVEDERRYLRALWDYPERLNESRVKPQDFFHSNYGLIMQAMIDVYNSGHAVEEIEVNRINPSIDAYELNGLLKTTGMVQNLKLYEVRISRDAVRRRLRTAGMKIKEVAETGSNLSEDIATASHLLEGIETGDDTEDFTGEDMANQFREEMLEGPQKRSGIMTHLPKLNYHTGGFQPGDFVVIGAFTNDGKSALKMNLAIHAATHGHAVGLISLEDSVSRYRNRMLSYLSGINSRILRNRDRDALSDFDSMSLVAAESILAEANLVMSHRSGMSIADIEGKARYWVKKYGIEVLFVDYIQIIDNPGFRDYRERMMDTVLRLTALCRNLGLVLITSSQINRDGAKKPELGNLAETSKIEHQADYVFLIEASTHQLEGEEIRIPDALVLAKGRDVPKGLRIPIHFMPERLKFAEELAGDISAPARVPLVAEPPSWREPELVAEDTERRTGS